MFYDKSVTQELFDEDGDEYYKRNYENPTGRHAYNLLIRRQISLSMIDETHQEVLDLGCGPGALALPMLAGGREVCGLDLSHKMVANATRLASQITLPSKYSFCQGDANSLPFHNDSFDLVTSTGVIEYIPDPHRALMEIRRVLKPGGGLIATGSPPRKFETSVTKMARRVLGRNKKTVVWHHQYSPDQFDELLLEAEFSIEARRYSFFLPFPLDIIFPALVQHVDQALSSTLQQSQYGRPLAKTYIVKAIKEKRD